MEVAVVESDLDDKLEAGSRTATSKIEIDFFANKYPYLKTLEMVGAFEKYGAQ